MCIRDRQECMGNPPSVSYAKVFVGCAAMRRGCCSHEIRRPEHGVQFLGFDYAGGCHVLELHVLA
eukprot:9198667-Pyramimonas_sp.AAC.1